MNRRAAIKTALAIATGFAILPRHLRSANGPSIKLSELRIGSVDESLLAEVVETLIPATDTPGAKELKVHLFVLKMLDDCHGAEDQRAFEAGLGQLDGYAQELTGKPFAGGDSVARENVLSSLSRKDLVSPELWSFNRLMRRRAIEGYRESEYVMTHLLPHRMIPAPYDGYYAASNYETKEVL